MWLERVGVSRVMVIRSPFVEMIGYVIASRIGCRILKIDHNKLKLAGVVLPHVLYGDLELRVEAEHRVGEDSHIERRCLLSA